MAGEDFLGCSIRAAEAQKPILVAPVALQSERQIWVLCSGVCISTYFLRFARDSLAQMIWSCSCTGSLWRGMRGRWSKRGVERARDPPSSCCTRLEKWPGQRRECHIIRPEKKCGRTKQRYERSFSYGGGLLYASKEEENRGRGLRDYTLPYFTVA